MKIISLSIASLATVAMFTGTVALAQPAREPAGDITRAEAEAKAATAFQRLDANGDGTLDEADRAARRQVMFERLDADGSGALSFAEFQSAREDRRAARREHGEARGALGGRGGGGLARVGRAADTDNDGALSQAEFRDAALARFDRADADRNGTVTDEERRMLREQIRGERGRGIG